MDCGNGGRKGDMDVIGVSIRASPRAECARRMPKIIDCFLTSDTMTAGGCGSMAECRSRSMSSRGPSAGFIRHSRRFHVPPMTQGRIFFGRQHPFWHSRHEPRRSIEGKQAGSRPPEVLHVPTRCRMAATASRLPIIEGTQAITSNLTGGRKPFFFLVRNSPARRVMLGLTKRSITVQPTGPRSGQRARTPAMYMNSGVN